GKDPFIDLKWPKAKKLPPDPLTAEEKEAILDCFLEHEPFYYPFVRVQFETAMRPSETKAITWADLNPDARTIRINKSRTKGHDNDHPKTTRSGRTIIVSRALMDLILSLKHPWQNGHSKVFLNKQGQPLRAEKFREDYWDRVLYAL